MAPKRKRRRHIDPRTLYIIRQGVLGVLIFSFLALIVTGVWYGTRIDSLTIERVEVVGGITIDEEEVRQKAEAELTGTYYRLVPKRFAWTYPKKRIVEAVESIDRVKGVHVERADEQALVVAFEEFIPRALWCGSIDGSDCYFIDQHGYAFAKAPRLTGGSFVRYVTLQGSPSARTQAVPKETLERTGRFIELLEEQLGFFVTVVEFDAVGDVFYTLAGGGELKASLENAPQATIENLAAILESEAFSHLRPGEFAYIDLRFGNKVYVSEEGLPIENATSTQNAEAAEILE